MKKNIFFILLLLSIHFISKAQSSTENYIHTKTYKVETTNGNVSSDNILEKVAYYDGLGRLKQTARKSGKDGDRVVIIPVEYDEYGRQTKEYMPYSKYRMSSTALDFESNNLVISESENYYTSQYPNELNSNSPNVYSEKSYEKSPLSRVLEQGAPGKSWELTSSNADHSIKYAYETNIENEVIYFKVNFNDPNNTEKPSLIREGFYIENQLFKQVTKDENWQPNQIFPNDHTTQEFTNKEGHLILKRTFNKGIAHDTHYIYDDYGNLTYVLPPDSYTTEVHNELIYIYHYDTKNRLIEKKIPGKGWEFIVYDNRDNPVLTQDAKLRSVNDWLFTKYDKLERIIYTGKHHYLPKDTLYESQARIELQSLLNSESFSNRESRITNSLPIDGPSSFYYTNNHYPTSNIEIYTVNYYDKYLNVSDTNGNIFSIPNTVENQLVNHESSGLQTTNVGLKLINKTRVLGTNDFITTFNAFDRKARLIYKAIDNPFLQTQDEYKIKLDFIGNEQYTIHTHNRSGKSPIVITDEFNYDYENRRVSHFQKGLHSLISSKEKIYRNVYGKQGNLITKYIGGTFHNIKSASGQIIPNYHLQKIDYNYNIRGWLTGINETPLIEEDLFGFNLEYDKSSISQYNGNIGSTSWMTATDSPGMLSNSVLRRYTYRYDALNRLNSANYTATYMRAFLNEDYSLRDVTYDKRGNIINLSRIGKLHDSQGNPISSYHNDPNNFNYIDRLTYTYKPHSNTLRKVDETASSYDGYKENTSYIEDFSYDVNGNMIENKDKNITEITYNHLNQPQYVQFGPFTENGTDYLGAGIEYVYTATGEKIQKKVIKYKPDSRPFFNPIVDYVEGVIYENSNLKFINHPEGYAEPKNTFDYSLGFDYIYQYKDHLGNVRLNYKEDLTVNVENIEESVFYDNLDDSSGWDSEGALYGTFGNIVNDFGYSGNNSVRLKSIDQSVYAHSNTWVEIDNPQTTTYKFSGYMYVTSTGPSNSCYARLLLFMNENEEQSYYTNVVHGERQYTKGQWVYYEEEVDVPANIDKINLRIDLGRNTSGNFSAWFDDLKIERILKQKPTKILKENNYYPFGLEHKGYNNVVNGTENNYFNYNGKELNESLDLNMVEMDWRQYDPAIARFNVVDPLADFANQVDKSPYSFGWNNPILYSDPSGLCPECPNPSDYNEGDTYEINGEVYVIDSTGQWSRQGGELEASIITAPAASSDDESELTTGMMPSSSYDYSSEVIPGKQDQDINFILNGYEPGMDTMLHRLVAILDRDYNADTNSQEMVEVLTLTTPFKVKGKSINSSVTIPKKFKKTKEFGRQHGQEVYKYKNKYYSPDVDSHNGGTWKVFEKKGGKLVRIGTADENLKIFKK